MITLTLNDEQVKMLSTLSEKTHLSTQEALTYALQKACEKLNVRRGHVRFVAEGREWLMSHYAEHVGIHPSMFSLNRGSVDKLTRLLESVGNPFGDPDAFPDPSIRKTAEAIFDAYRKRDAS